MSSNIERAVLASVLIGRTVVINGDGHEGTLDVVVAVKAGAAPDRAPTLIFNDDREYVLTDSIADLYIEGVEWA